jgi:D-sedoheptulose 7-phosphate isomerase
MMATATKTNVVQRIKESIALKQRLIDDSGYVTMVCTVGLAMADAIRRGNKIFFFGNGGSAADAHHLAAELTGRYLRERKALAALALSENMSSLTAIGNDYGYEFVYSRQLEGLGKNCDVAVALSTSGNSPNILLAMETARKMGMVGVGLTGQTGGHLKNLVDYCLCVPSEDVPRVQEAHMLIGHVLCEIIEDETFG